MNAYKKQERFFKKVKKLHKCKESTEVATQDFRRTLVFALKRPDVKHIEGRRTFTKGDYLEIKIYGDENTLTNDYSLILWEYDPSIGIFDYKIVKSFENKDFLMYASEDYARFVLDSYIHNKKLNKDNVLIDEEKCSGVAYKEKLEAEVGASI